MHWVSKKFKNHDKTSSQAISTVPGALGKYDKTASSINCEYQVHWVSDKFKNHDKTVSIEYQRYQVHWVSNKSRIMTKPLVYSINSMV